MKAGPGIESDGEYYCEWSGTFSGRHHLTRLPEAGKSELWDCYEQSIPGEENGGEEPRGGMCAWVVGVEKSTQRETGAGARSMSLRASGPRQCFKV